MNLRQRFIDVLGGLRNLEVGVVKELVPLLEGTSLEPFKENLEKAISFRELRGNWPSYAVINTGLEDALPQADVGPDHVFQLAIELKEEFFQTELMAASLKADWKKVEEIVATRTQKTISTKFVPYLVDDAISEYERMKLLPKGILLGIDVLDRHLKRIPHKATSIWAAPPGMFKTSSAISAAFFNAFCQGLNVVYVTLEVPKRNIWFQTLSRLSGVAPGSRLPSEGIKKCELTPDAEARLYELAEHWKANATGNLQIVDRLDLGDGSFKSILNALNSVNEQFTDGIDLVLWDYIQLFKYFKQKGQTEVEYVNSLIQYLDAVCKSYREKGFVNVILSQVNRQGELKIGRKRVADLTLLAEFNELERIANSVVVFYADNAMKLNRELIAQVVKHRDGTVMETMESVFVDAEISQVGTGGPQQQQTISYGLDDLGIPDDVGNMDIFHL